MIFLNVILNKKSIYFKIYLILLVIFFLCNIFLYNIIINICY